MKRSWLLAPVAALLLAIPASAVIIGPFPGLARLIEKADAIAVVRIDEPLEPGIRPNGFTLQRCFVYQVLKGDLRAGTFTPLLLRDPGTSPASPFARGSAHLIFFTRLGPPDRGAHYVTAHVEGASLRVAPLGNERKPEGKTTGDQIRSIIRRSMKSFEEERRREDELLRKVLGS
jgi:hypothetical protein